jgi:hypothetical protein
LIEVEEQIRSEVTGECNDRLLKDVSRVDFRNEAREIDRRIGLIACNAIRIAANCMSRKRGYGCGSDTGQGNGLVVYN